jgi:aspartate aminotransferase-like enzyme
MQAGMQVAAGVQLECGEPEGFSTFRIGLFGLDKLTDIDRTVANLEKTLEAVRGQNS